EAKLDDVVYPGVVNLGYRPTMTSGGSDRTLEVYLLDFDRDIYGKDLELRFVRYLRPEKKFENVDALVRQIERDVRQARELDKVRSNGGDQKSSRVRSRISGVLRMAKMTANAPTTRPQPNANTSNSQIGKFANSIIPSRTM